MVTADQAVTAETLTNNNVSATETSHLIEPISNTALASSNGSSKVTTNGKVLEDDDLCTRAQHQTIEILLSELIWDALRVGLNTRKQPSTTIDITPVQLRPVTASSSGSNISRKASKQRPMSLGYPSSTIVPTHTQTVTVGPTLLSTPRHASTDNTASSSSQPKPAITTGASQNTFSSSSEGGSSVLVSVGASRTVSFSRISGPGGAASVIGPSMSNGRPVSMAGTGTSSAELYLNVMGDSQDEHRRSSYELQSPGTANQVVNGLMVQMHSAPSPFRQGKFYPKFFLKLKEKQSRIPGHLNSMKNGASLRRKLKRGNRKMMALQ